MLRDDVSKEALDAFDREIVDALMFAVDQVERGRWPEECLSLGILAALSGLSRLNGMKASADLLETLRSRCTDALKKWKST